MVTDWSSARGLAALDWRNRLKKLVARGGIEPPTSRFSVRWDGDLGESAVRARG